MQKCTRILIVCIIAITFPSLVFAAKIHKVRKNDTLKTLAKRYHVSPSEIKAANNIVNDRLRYGQTLVIPPRSVASSEEGGAKHSRLYKVKKGDTLYRIARKTGLSVKELKRLNHLAKDRLKKGQVLALRDRRRSEEPKKEATKRVFLVNKDLFSEKEYEQSLADLTNSDQDQPVDINKDVELKTDKVKMLKTAAYGFLGTRYRFGGSSRNGIDCSAFVQKVFRELQVSLPRSAREQFEMGTKVAPGDLRKGDLVFFSTYAPYASHVGIYLGDNKMIHASSHDRRVVVSSINTPYYRSRYLGAKRFEKINPETLKFGDLVNGVEEESENDAVKNDTLGLNN